VLGFQHHTGLNFLTQNKVKKKGKDIPVTGRGGP
jgi:hypothetical protein